MVSDVRYYGVAPHWYFRPLMAWLIACPFHKTGILGLVFFFIGVYIQPGLQGFSEQGAYAVKPLLLFSFFIERSSMLISGYSFVESNYYYQFFFFLFTGCVLYTTSFLPYGRFFSRLGGNWGFILSYFLVFLYLGLRWLRRPLLIDLFFSYLYSIVLSVRAQRG